MNDIMSEHTMNEFQKRECNCCYGGYVTSSAHEAIDADYEPLECGCPCHIPICKYCEEEGIGEWNDSPVCQDCFEGFTGNKFPVANSYAYLAGWLD